MDIHHALLGIGLLVVSAKVAEGLLRHVGLNLIVAYTAAGALLGPVTGIGLNRSAVDGGSTRRH